MLSISKGDLKQIEKDVDVIESRLEQYYRIQEIDFIVFNDWNELETYFR
jgi:hypothetical protein